MAHILSLPPPIENYEGHSKTLYLPAATNTVIGGFPSFDGGFPSFEGGAPWEDVEGGSDLKKPRLSSSSPYGNIGAIPTWEMKIPWSKSETKESDIKYIKREGLATIDAEKTLEQLDTAATKIAALCGVEDPHGILVASDVLTPVPEFLKNFAKWTSTSVLKRPDYTPGTLTASRKPSMLIITYPTTEGHLCLIEDAYLAKIPIVAICQFDCPNKFLDGATIIPANCNERALSCLFTLLSRMMWQKLGLIPEGPEITVPDPYDHYGGSWYWYPLEPEEEGGRKLYLGKGWMNDKKSDEFEEPPCFGRRCQ